MKGGWRTESITGTCWVSKRKYGRRWREEEKNGGQEEEAVQTMDLFYKFSTF